MPDASFALPNPEDARYTWTHESMHVPLAVPPLPADFFGAVLGAINARLESLGIPMATESRIVNGYLYVAQYSKDPEVDTNALFERLRPLRFAAAQDVRRVWEEEVLPELDTHYDWMRRSPTKGADLHVLADEWAKAWEIAQDVYRLHFRITGGSYPALEELADIYESLLDAPPAGEAFKLVQGRSQHLYRVQKDLHTLASVAAENSGISSAILNGKPVPDLRDLDGADGFMKQFDAFLHAHGHLGHAFDDLTQPSWSDRPDLVLEEVRKRLKTPQEDPELRRERLLAESDELADVVRAKLEGKESELQRFESALELARDVGPLTEDHNYIIDRMFHTLMRRFVMSVGDRLAELDAIQAPEDIFFLHSSEVTEFLNNPRSMHTLIAARKADLTFWRSLTPPRRLGKKIEEEEPERKDRFFSHFESPTPDEDRHLLRGHPACSGIARGTARLVSSPEDFGKVNPGDVLVCASSNPSYVPLFGIISGVVTDTGGVVSHAAVVAREFGIPAVVGTTTATKTIEEGQTVELDGAKGEVRLL